jgi:hypothetical protein
MGFWDIDYDLLPARLLPVRIRKGTFIAWLKALLAPVKELYNNLLDYRQASLYGLAHNGQVCYLEAALNDVFDPVGRGIIITDGSYTDPLWLAIGLEEAPMWLPMDGEGSPLWLPTDAEVAEMGFDFIVIVPSGLMGAAEEPRLRALVDKYRIAGKMDYDVVY